MWWIIGTLAVLGIVAVAAVLILRAQQKAQDEQHYAEPEQDDEPEEEPRTIAGADPIEVWGVRRAATPTLTGTPTVEPQGEIYRAQRPQTFAEEMPVNTFGSDFNFDGIPDLLGQPMFSPGLEPAYEAPQQPDPAPAYCAPDPTPAPSYDPPAPAPDYCPAPAPDPTPAPAPDYGSSSSYDSGSSSSYDNGSSGW